MLINDLCFMSPYLWKGLVVFKESSSQEASQTMILTANVTSDSVRKSYPSPKTHTLLDIPSTRNFWEFLSNHDQPGSSNFSSDIQIIQPLLQCLLKGNFKISYTKPQWNWLEGWRYTFDACTTLLMKKMLASSEHYMSALGNPRYRKHSLAITPFYIRGKLRHGRFQCFQ